MAQDRRETEALRTSSETQFEHLDEDNNGRLDAEELKDLGTFESAGITVSLPMNVDTFVALYRRVKESEKKDSGSR